MKGPLQKHPLPTRFLFGEEALQFLYLYIVTVCLSSCFFFVYTRCLPMFQLTLYYVLFLGGSSSKSGSLDLECTEDFPSYQQNTK